MGIERKYGATSQPNKFDHAIILSKPIKAVIYDTELILEELAKSDTRDRIIELVDDLVTNNKKAAALMQYEAEVRESGLYEESIRKLFPDFPWDEYKEYVEG